MKPLRPVVQILEYRSRLLLVYIFTTACYPCWIMWYQTHEQRYGVGTVFTIQCTSCIHCVVQFSVSDVWCTGLCCNLPRINMILWTNLCVKLHTTIVFRIYYEQWLISQTGYHLVFLNTTIFINILTHLKKIILLK